MKAWQVAVIAVVAVLVIVVFTFIYVGQKTDTLGGQIQTTVQENSKTAQQRFDDLDKRLEVLQKQTTDAVQAASLSSEKRISETFRASSADIVRGTNNRIDTLDASLTKQITALAAASSTAGSKTWAYLSDLPERDTKVGWGVFGKKGWLGYDVNGVKKIVVNSTESPNGISIHPPSNGASHVAYDLNGKYKRFVAAVALNDGTGNSPVPLTFKVLGDGTLLWQSTPVHVSNQVQDVDVSVENVKRLELMVDCPGDNNSRLAVWVEPRLKP